MQTKISSSALASCSKGTSVPAGIHAYAFVVTLALLTVNLASAQQGNVEQLAEQSAIVVSGKVVRLNASGEPLVAPSNRVAVISVERMYAGSEIAGDQTGRTVTVILSQPEGVKLGEEAIFFGNPRFVGRSLTIADQGEVPSKALESMQALDHFSTYLSGEIGNNAVIVTLLGIGSAIVDNVPLVAASIGMFSSNAFPTDHTIWEYLAYCAGTGGSLLVMGSAAGVAVMGMEKIDFIWYLKKISPLALIGFLAGAGFYLLLSNA